MNEDRGRRSMNIMQVHLPDSYSTARNNLYDDIHSLSHAVTSFGPTQSSRTATSSTCPQFRRRQSGGGQNGTRVVRANPAAVPDNVLGLVGSIHFNEVAEDVHPTPFQNRATDDGELQDILEERTQSYEYLTHPYPLSYTSCEAGYGSRSSTGTVIYGDDARNAIQQAEEYRGLFEAAERSVPRSSDPDSVHETDPSYDMQLDWTTAGTTPNEGPPIFVPSSAYESRSSRGQRSLRPIHAATSDPLYLMPPALVAESAQHTSFDNEDALGRSNPITNATPASHAASSRASSISPPSIMSEEPPASCLSTTTVSTPPIKNGLKCPVLGCGHKPFTGRSKKNSLSRHIRQHGEKFSCQLGNCGAVIGRSDNRRTHLENIHPSISLPPKSSSRRVRSEPGGVDEVVERCFTRIRS